MYGVAMASTLKPLCRIKMRHYDHIELLIYRVIESNTNKSDAT